MRKPSGPIQHVVIIVRENHTCDSYCGGLPGVDGDGNLAPATDPPSTDHPHEHAAWLKRATGAAKEQYGQANIPNYWRYARQFTLCDRYFTEVAGPSKPNHPMVVAAPPPVLHQPPHPDPDQKHATLHHPSPPPAPLEGGLTLRQHKR